MNCSTSSFVSVRVERKLWFTWVLFNGLSLFAGLAGHSSGTQGAGREGDWGSNVCVCVCVLCF